MAKIIIIFNFFIFIFFNKNVLSLDNKYKLEILKSNLSSPWSLTFINNNQILISEKTGKIKFIQGDWTLPNEEILEFLGENKRYGIPFNVVYGPQNSNGIILPEILTKKVLLKALENVK